MNASEYVLTYHRKPETKTSYLREPGPGLLPERIGFSTDGFTPIKRTGAAILFEKLGQVKAEFKKSEQSPYKHPKALQAFIHFTLFKIAGLPDAGFANIAFAGESESRSVIKTNDLVIARFLDSDRQTLEIRLFPGQYDQREEIVNRLKVKK
jgi:hypothetical protein